ncbi:hypothetical protein ACP70R_030777 [Stipagrostis hirtigluma subsp. patula]
MASAATTASFVLLLLMASVLPASDALPPNVRDIIRFIPPVRDFIQERIAAIDVLYWARMAARDWREKWCATKGRRRPLKFPYKLRFSFPFVVLRDNITLKDALTWHFHVTARSMQSFLCVPREWVKEGRSCCCCGGLISGRCCCCC